MIKIKRNVIKIMKILRISYWFDEILLRYFRSWFCVFLIFERDLFIFLLILYKLLVIKVSSIFFSFNLSLSVIWYDCDWISINVII